MDINDIKHLAVERIFLVPDASEGQLGYVWCDDPAPGVGMDASEAVEYVRKDVHEALATEVETAKRDYECMFKFYKAAESDAKQLAGENNQLTERIAELEAGCAAHKAAEEMQIALRERVQEERDALAAQVEELISVLILAKNSHGVFLMSDPPQDAWKKNNVDDAITDALKKEPPNILTCRDLLQRAEELESLAKNAPPEMDGPTWRYLQDKINALHQQVEESGQ